MKAIQTYYNGIKFRSKMEAQTAFFLDRAGFSWEYEPEGVTMRSGKKYLPDFMIHCNLRETDKIFIEVKGVFNQGRNDEEKVKEFFNDPDYGYPSVPTIIIDRFVPLYQFLKLHGTPNNPYEPVTKAKGSKELFTWCLYGYNNGGDFFYNDEKTPDPLVFVGNGSFGAPSEYLECLEYERTNRLPSNKRFVWLEYERAKRILEDTINFGYKK